MLLYFCQLIDPSRHRHLYDIIITEPLELQGRVLRVVRGVIFVIFITYQPIFGAGNGVKIL